MKIFKILFTKDFIKFLFEKKRIRQLCIVCIGTIIIAIIYGLFGIICLVDGKIDIKNTLIIMQSIFLLNFLIIRY